MVFLANDFAPLIRWAAVVSKYIVLAAGINPHFWRSALDPRVLKDARDFAGDGCIDLLRGHWEGAAVRDILDFDSHAVAKAVDFIFAIGRKNVFIDHARNGKLAAGLGDDVFEDFASLISVVLAADFNERAHDPSGNLIGGGVEEDDVGGFGEAIFVGDGVGVALGGEGFPIWDNDGARLAGFHVAGALQGGAEFVGELSCGGIGWGGGYGGGGDAEQREQGG